VLLQSLSIFIRKSSAGLLLAGLFLVSHPLLSACPEDLDAYIKESTSLLRSPDISVTSKDSLHRVLLTSALKAEQQKCAVAAGRMYSLAAIYFDVTQRKDSASLYYFRALPLLESAYLSGPLRRQDSGDLAVLYANCTRFFRIKGEWGSALKLAEKCLSINKVLSGKKRLGASYIRLGNIHNLLANQDEAISFFRQAYVAFENEGASASRLATAAGNLVSAFASTDNLDSALHYFRLTQSLLSPQDYNARFDSYYNLGRAYLRADMPQEAYDSLQVCQQMLDSLTTDVLEASAPVNLGNLLGNVCQALGKPKEAIMYFRTARAAFSPYMADDLKSKVAENLGFAFLENGQRDSALFYIQESQETYQRMVAVQDSMFSQEINFLLSSVENQREALLKAREVERQNRAIQYLVIGLVATCLLVGLLLLYLRIRKIRFEQQLSDTAHAADKRVGDAIVDIYRTEQAALTQERNELGRILHERIQGQIAISKMLVQNVEAALESAQSGVKEHLELIRNTLTESNEQVRTISHKLKDGQSYHERFEGRLFEDFQKILEPYRKSKLFDTVALHTHFAPLDMQTQKLYLPGATKNSLLSWVQSLLTNAVKYSHASQIDLNLHLEGRFLTVTVTDNGVGIPEKWESQSSALSGLKSLKRELEALGGSFSIEGKQGTHALIRLPLADL